MVEYFKKMIHKMYCLSVWTSYKELFLATSNLVVKWINQKSTL